MSAKTMKFEGTPSSIGADVFIDMVMPVIREASKKMDSNGLAMLYSGFLGAMYGSLCADFGQPMGKRMLEVFTQKLLAIEPLETLQ